MRACGPSSPAAALGIAQDVDIRCVFGLTALREKLVCQEAGLNDVLLEVLKYRIALPEDARPLSEANHLRLMEVTDTRLVFLLGGDDPLQQPALCEVDRSDYDALVASPPPRTDLFSGLIRGPYVDLGRLVVRCQSQATEM